MQKIGAAAPHNVYVCRNLRNIPPVSMHQVDPVTLLKQTNELSAKIDMIQAAGEQQLGMIMETVHLLRTEIREVNVAVQPNISTLVQLPSTPVQQQRPLPPPMQQLQQQHPQQQQALQYNTVLRNGLEEPSAFAQNTSSQRQRGLRTPVPYNTPAGQGQEPARYGGGQRQSQGGRRGFWETDEEGFSRHVRAPRRRPAPLIGTGKQSRLQVARGHRQCHVFVSRLAPHTTEEEVAGVVEDISGEKPMKVEKLKTRDTNYASFHVTAAEDHREALLNIEAWDEGTLVRRFFRQRLTPRTEDNVGNGGSQSVDNSSVTSSNTTTNLEGAEIVNETNFVESNQAVNVNGDHSPNS